MLKKDQSSSKSNNDECDHDNYDYNSYSEDSYSDSDDEYSQCPSDFDEWTKWNEERLKNRKKVK